MSGDDRGGARIERLLMLLAVAALAIALALSEWTRLHENRRLFDREAALEAGVEDARTQAQAALSAVIAPDIVAAASASVYLIVVDGAPRGTAFVIDRERGVLATAAHTAESLPLDEPGADIHILNRQTRTPLTVTGRKLHAGFGAFRKIVEEYQPVRTNSSVYAPLAAPVRDLAFDAAQIFVDPLDPATGENRLGPALKTATEEKLLSLKAGAPIAIIGYPYDTLDDGFSIDAATSRAERGVISAMIAPLDAAAYAPDPVLANLIIHRLATAGGNSGSPVIDVDGEVIGIHTHGIESVSSNADGAAQRGDVLYDLAAPDREARRLEDVFMPAWRRRLQHWTRADDALPWSFYMEYADPGREPAPTLAGIDFTAPAPFQKNIRSLEFGSAVDKFRVAAEAAAADDGAAAFSIDESGEFARYRVEADRAREMVLFAYDYSLRSTTGSCKITSYVRKRGDARLEVRRNRSSFELHLAAAGPRTESYEIILRRAAGCDPLSRTFMAGEISWPMASDGDPAIVAVGYDRPAPEAALDRGRHLAHTAQTSISRFFDCALGADKDADRCQKPEYIEITE